MDEDGFTALVIRIALLDREFETAYQAGLIPAAEAKAYVAHRTEWIEELDRARGVAAVTYGQFVEAFTKGASCQVLMELKSRMDPKDPLRDAAIADLRSIACYSAASLRRAADDQR